MGENAADSISAFGQNDLGDNIVEIGNQDALGSQLDCINDVRTSTQTSPQKKVQFNLFPDVR